jgi:tetratricopeptide (TPR) repeat protein
VPSISSNTSECSQNPDTQFHGKTLPIKENLLNGLGNFGLTAPPPLPETSVPPRAVREVALPRTPLAKPAAPAPDAFVRAPAADSPRREPADAAIGLRLTRAVPRAEPALERAYDALLGLATLAARRGESDAAHAYYLRALEADPSDATARAGVFSTGRPGDETAAESHLKTALARDPGSPPLNFALGNLYARQQRWSEAQQAYFSAYAGDPGNPDVIFNLAVSLDQLREGRLAARYYRMALEAGEARTPAFDRNQVTSRLEALYP